MNQKTIKYGVIGFSKSQFDQITARKILDELFLTLKNQHRNSSIEIVSGYTNSGVPKIAYELADKHGFITVGYSAQQALEVDAGVYPVSKVILKGEQFGDESEEFISYIDRLIKIGGGNQSKKELDLFKKKHSNQISSTLLIEHEVEDFD